MERGPSRHPPDRGCPPGDRADPSAARVRTPEVARPRPLNLNGVIRDISEILRRTLGEHIDLLTSQAPDLWPIMADPGQLEQVLVNLAVNARDAIPGGGTLSIDTQNLQLDAEQAASRPGLHPGRYVRMRISDTGTGMPPNVLENAL
jgi:signal transduction histidine kinase